MALKGGSSDHWTKILDILKNHPYIPKAFQFLLENPSSRKPSANRRNKRINTAQVDTDGNHVLYLLEQLAHLHIGNTQKKASNIASGENIMENNYRYMFVV